MKFSVLLPTRNRLEFLKYAISSVLQQDETDWEIIVSDNASEEDIFGYIQSLNDSRIKYSRTDSFISITDNWNRALNKSSGEWIIMLGDDDCLMKGYFSTINKLIQEYPNPEFIYSRSFLYAYPRVMPDQPDGFLKIWANAVFLSGKSSPFWLTKEQMLQCVQKTFNFQVAFTFNMQFATIHRSFIEKLKYQGNFFHSPYPDFYAMTYMMLHAERVLACPYPLVTVGISPKSYGFYLFNNIEDQGVTTVLNNHKDKGHLSELEKIVLPGADLNTSWLLSLLAVKNNSNSHVMTPNYKRYRFVQIIKFYNKYIVGGKKEKTSSLMKLWKKLSWSEMSLYAFPLFLCATLIRLFPLKVRLRCVGKLERMVKMYPSLYSEIINDKFENILEVFERVDPLDVASLSIKLRT